jgi:uncharacterized protein
METVLITGASSGIGLELAQLFAADGSQLVLAARRQDRLEALATELQARHHVACTVLPVDLTDPSAPRVIFDRLAAQGVTVDVLVNNAGFGAVGPVCDLPIERQVAMVQVNVAALVHLTSLFLPGMVERQRGGILNVGSLAGFQPGPRMAVYYATKAFVLSYTEALAEELARTGVTATCLAPGPTVTEFEDASGMGNAWLFKFGPMQASTVARAGYRGFRRGRVLVVPGLGNRLLSWFVPLAPRRLVRKVVKRLHRP